MALTLARKKEIYEHFAQYITAERKAKIEKVSAQRTRYVTVVLEDIYQSHNTSAVLRSCECFSIQEVHIIEQRHTFSIHESVAKGAAQWLDIKRYKGRETNNTQRCFEELKKQGYKIAATSPHKNDLLINNMPLETKVALVFGTEQEGLSSYALNNADMFVKIPMYGFTESFNISVSAALCLYDISQRLRSSDIQWHLSQEELIDLQLKWLAQSTYFSKQINELLSQ